MFDTISIAMWATIGGGVIAFAFADYLLSSKKKISA
jgi:ABC-type phosphate/phosphonate transport system permease subunit